MQLRPSTKKANRSRLPAIPLRVGRDVLRFPAIPPTPPRVRRQAPESVEDAIAQRCPLGPRRAVRRSSLGSVRGLSSASSSWSGKSSGRSGRTAPMQGLPEHSGNLLPRPRPSAQSTSALCPAEHDLSLVISSTPAAPSRVASPRGGARFRRRFQAGRAGNPSPALGAGSRRFESARPDLASFGRLGLRPASRRARKPRGLFLGG